MADLPDETRSALAALLDTLIPPHGDVAGAGTLGVGDAVTDALDAMPGAVDALREHLTALDAAASELGAASFAALGAPARSELVAARADADPGFLPGLIFQTYTHYYQEPAVLVALGQEARPPAPLGYPMEPSDLDALTARVRTLPKLFRET